MANVLVAVEGDRILAPLGHRHFKTLCVETSGLLSLGCASMTLDSKRILLFAGDAVLVGDQLCGLSHVEVVVLVPQTIVDHGVDQLAMAQTHAAARFGQQVRCVGHGLHAARKDAIRVACANGLRGQHDGLQTRTANLVDGHGANGCGNSRAQRNLASRVLTQARCKNVAKDDLLDCRGVNARAGDSLLCSKGSQFGSGHG